MSAKHLYLNNTAATRSLSIFERITRSTNNKGACIKIIYNEQLLIRRSVSRGASVEVRGRQIDSAVCATGEGSEFDPIIPAEDLC